LAVIKNNGGVIASLSSSRLAYFQSNFVINQKLFEYFTDPENESIRLGDLILNSKPSGQLTARCFVLLGDPALKLSIPKYKVVTETINGIDVTLQQDTIHPGSQINVTGLIKDFQGIAPINFNGDLYTKVFERPYIKTTLGNQQNSYPVDIILQDIILLELQVEVVAGQFEYTFVLPNDVSQEFGKIRLSHYAFNEIEDASGHYSDLVVGGEPNTILELSSELELVSFYPTIVIDYLNYYFYQDIQDLRIEILDITGQKAFYYSSSNNLKGEQNHIDISEFSKGFYLIHALADGNHIYQKIIVE